MSEILTSSGSAIRFAGSTEPIRSLLDKPITPQGTQALEAVLSWLSTLGLEMSADKAHRMAQILSNPTPERRGGLQTPRPLK